MAASKVTRYTCKASLQHLLHGHHRSITAAASTATTRLNKNAGESSQVHPFAVQVPPFPGLQPSKNGSVTAFGAGNWFPAQEIRRVIPSALQSVRALHQSRVLARGGPVNIDDDDNINSDDDDDDDDDDDESYDSDEIPTDSEDVDDCDDDDGDEENFASGRK